MMTMLFTHGITFTLGMCAGVGLLIAIQETRPHIKRERMAREAAQAQLRG